MKRDLMELGHRLERPFNSRTATPIAQVEAFVPEPVLEEPRKSAIIHQKIFQLKYNVSSFLPWNMRI